MGRAHNGVGVHQGVAGVHGAGDTKVCYLHTARFRNEHVVRLNVAVHDAHSVRVFQTFCNSNGKFYGVIDGQSFVPRNVFF